jgi:hypothetical protein
MAQDIVGGLFGITPEMYQQQMAQQGLAEGAKLGQMAPDAFGRSMLYAGSAQLGRGIGGAMGAQDPTLLKITAQDQILKSLDFTNPNSIATGIERATQAGIPELAYRLIAARDEASVRQQRDLAARRQALVDQIAMRGYQPGQPERPQQLDVQEQQQMADQGTPIPPNIPAVPSSYDISRVAPELMALGTEGIAKLTATRAAEKALMPEFKTLKRGEKIVEKDPSTGNWSFITPKGLETVSGGSNPITGMINSSAVDPTVTPYARELANQWPNLDDKERTDALSSLTTINNTALARTQKAAELSAGGQDKVQSSKVTPDGTTILVMKNGQTKVISNEGTELTGVDRANAIRTSESFGADVQGARAQQRTGGELTAKQVGIAFAEIGKIKKNIVNIDEAIELIDKGANTGVIASKLPNVQSASIQLANVRNQLGLDVIGSVTFGALSEGELNLALNTALPTNLEPTELRKYLVNKKTAQEKVIKNLTTAATYLNVKGNSLSGWLEKVQNMEPTSGNNLQDQAKAELAKRQQANQGK